MGGVGKRKKPAKAYKQRPLKKGEKRYEPEEDDTGAVAMADGDPTTPPDEDWVKKHCQPGKGHLTCRYLAMGPKGWSCEKSTELGRLMDRRVAGKICIARGDNCTGRAANPPPHLEAKSTNERSTVH